MESVDSVSRATQADRSLNDVILDPLENALDSVGLMQGEMAPLKRTALGAAIGFGVMGLWKPSWAYGSDHKPYPWSVTAPKDTPADKKTKVPYWMAALVPAVVLGVLI